MNDTDYQIDDLWLAVGLIGLAIATLMVLIRRGCFRAGAMADGPRRNVGLRWFDLPAGIGVVLLALIAAGSASYWWFGAEDAVGDARSQAVELFIIQSVAGVALLVYLLWRLEGVSHGWRRFGLVPRSPLADLRTGLIGLVAALLLVPGLLSLMGLVGVWIGMPPPALGHELLDQMRQTDDVLALALFITGAVLLAPLVEELLFRGLAQTVLLNLLGPSQRWLILVIVGLGFSMIHLGAVTWHALPALAALGVLLGWLYEKTGSLWPPIIVHAGFNIYNVAFVMTGLA